MTKPASKKPGKKSVSISIRQLPSLGGAVIYCAHTDILPLDVLLKLKNPRNPNKHPKKQIRQLAKIIRKGWRYAVVISRRSGLVIKGHGRIDAAAYSEPASKECPEGIAKLTHCPVDYQDYASEAEEIADMLADNAIAELSERHMPTVSALIEEIDTGAFDLELTGYPPAKLERIMLAAPPDLSKLEKKKEKVTCPKCKHKFLPEA